MKMRPIYETACLLALGWHGHHPSRADRGRCRDADALVKSLRLRRLEHRPYQPARHGRKKRAWSALAGIERALPEPSAELAVRLMPQPQPGQLDRGTAGARIARLADPLVAIGSAALPWTGRQPEIARDLAPVAEVLVEHLLGQRLRERRAKTFEPLQKLAAPNHLSHRRRRIRRGWCPLQRIELLAHQHQPRMLVLDLAQNPRPQPLALPIPLPCQPGQPVTPARLPDRKTMQPQQRLDPVGVSGLFLGQPTAFARVTARILLLRRWHTDDPNHARLSAQIGHQRSQHLLAVDPVGLHRPGPLIHRDARRIEHVVRDPRRYQKPMQPKPVITSLVATHHRGHRSQSLYRPIAHPIDQRQQARVIPVLHLVPGNLIPVRTVQRYQPGLLAQFDRNKNRANMPCDGRAYGRCLHLTSPWVRVCKPKSSGCTLITPWNLRCRPRNDGLSLRQDGSLSRKYGSTGPWTFMVSGLPWRSLALPAVTRTQPSLTQYSSTLVFSAPLKRMPTSRATTSAL